MGNALQQLPDQGQRFRQIFRLRPVITPGVKGENAVAETVDGAETDRHGVRFCPGQLQEPRFHVVGGGVGIGDDQNRRRINPLLHDHVPKPGHQCGGFPAARHSQKQNLTRRLDCFLLLFR